MADPEWMIKGPHCRSCSCNWGCPCQFNIAPSHGHRHATGALRIGEDYFGDVMNLLRIGAIPIFVLLEKVLPVGLIAGKWLGPLMIVCGFAVLVLG